MAFHLHCNFGGLNLTSPVIVGACPLTLNDQTRIAIQTAGAGAIVLPSLFEEQVITWSRKVGRAITQREEQIVSNAQHTQHNWACADAESYLSLVNRASSLQSIPVIASLNGFTAGGWMDFAGELQAAGAAAIELNVDHVRPRDFGSSTEIETTILDSVRDLDAAITIPVFVKLGRNLTSIPHLARQLLSGSQGLILHGRTPTADICLDTLNLSRRWKLTPVAIDSEMINTLMQVHSYCPAMPLCASGGISRPEHLIKALLAGADAVMVTSVIYREGPDAIRILLDGLTHFMEQHHMPKLLDLQLARPLKFNSEHERSAYIAAISSHRESPEEPTESHLLHGDRWGHSAMLSNLEYL